MYLHKIYDINLIVISVKTKNDVECQFVVPWQYFCLRFQVQQVRILIKLHRFVLRMKNSYCFVHRSFYRAFQNFQYITTLCSFLMTDIGTKFRYVFKLHISDLHTKISHCFQHILFTGHFKTYCT